MRRVAAAADLLLPQRAGDVDQRAAAVALAVHVAGPVEHLLKGVERLRDDVVRGPAVTANGGVECTRVLVLDGLGRAQGPVGLERRDAGTVLRLDLTAAAGGAALRRVGAHFSSRVPRLLRGDARRVREGTRSIVRGRAAQKPAATDANLAPPHTPGRGI